MNHLLPILALFIVLAACNQPNSPTSTTLQVEEREYPAAMQKIFTKHGSLAQWQKMKALSYEIVDPEGNEKQAIHLIDRRERIEGSNYITGYDGKDIWVEADSTYKGNPAFYHNLMFYFYAMPFVLADDGIIYSDTDSLDFEGKKYPGIRISYEAAIGGSPKDEYFIHYDPETYQMAWLGYTVTYRSGEKSDNVKWIRYNDWMTVDDVVLPKSFTWHAYEGKTIKEAKNTVAFENVSVSTSGQPEGFYAKPESAKYVKGKE